MTEASAGPAQVAGALMRGAIRLDRPGSADTSALSALVDRFLSTRSTDEVKRVVEYLTVLAVAFAAPWPSAERDRLIEVAEQPDHVTALLADVYETLERSEGEG